MTSKTKNTTIVFAFAALLLVMPLSAGSVYAQVGGSGEINPSCGIVSPSSINLGGVSVGATSLGEVKISIPTEATIPGTFELTSTDWVGVGKKATGSLIIIDDPTGKTITINGQPFLGGDGTIGEGQFDVGSSTSDAATNLATAINTDAQSNTGEFGSSIEVTAFAVDNAVLLTANQAGVGPNAIIIADDGTGKFFSIITSTMTGGTVAGEIHMLSEQVKVTVQTQSELAPNTDYTDVDKIALGADGENVILTTATDPDNAEDIDLYFHLDGVNTKATGTITISGDLVNGDTIVIGNTKFIAETTLDDVTADVEAGEYKFFSSDDKVKEAASLNAAINAVPNNPEVISTVDKDDNKTIIITAVKPGFSGNKLVFTESTTGPSVIIFPTVGTLDGGDEQLINLPYSGAITATFVFSASCDATN